MDNKYSYFELSFVYTRHDQYPDVIIISSNNSSFLLKGGTYLTGALIAEVYSYPQSTYSERGGYLALGSLSVILW